MIMNDKVRDFIEQNIELIELNNFDKLIRKCPTDLRPGLFQALAEAGIEFPDIEDGTLYGLQTVPDITHWFGKTFRDTHKLCISSLDKKTGEYRYSYVKANGVKGGYQIAFPSLKKAMNFANKVRQEENLAPYLISYPEGYNWDIVTLVNGEQVLATDKCIKDLDPYEREQKKLKEKAFGEIMLEVEQWAKDLSKKIDTTVLDKMNKNKNDSRPIRSPITFYYSNSYGRGRVMSGLGYFVDIDEKEILDYLNSILDVDNIKYEDIDIIIEDSYIDQVEKDIYSKYGVKI